VWRQTITAKGVPRATLATWTKADGRALSTEGRQYREQRAQDEANREHKDNEHKIREHSDENR
jgi:hypothetical protein